MLSYKNGYKHHHPVTYSHFALLYFPYINIPADSPPPQNNQRKDILSLQTHPRQTNTRPYRSPIPAFSIRNIRSAAPAYSSSDRSRASSSSMAPLIQFQQMFLNQFPGAFMEAADPGLIRAGNHISPAVHHVRNVRFKYGQQKYRSIAASHALRQKRRYVVPQRGAYRLFLWGNPKGATPLLAHDFACKV